MEIPLFLTLPANPKVFTANKNGKIKAGKKKDHAVLTITLKSGLKKTVKVNVRKLP